VIGLGYGDEGKGTTVDWLTRQSGVELVVRFNGGAQAGHNVVLPDGRHHTFSQFGSGTFAGAKTYLSEYMLVNPVTALSEAAKLETVGVVDPFSQLFVDENALVTTPYHVAANRIREICRGEAQHGSCGMGIGETVADSLADTMGVIRVRDLMDSDRLRVKLQTHQERKREQLRSTMDTPRSSRVREEWAVLEDPVDLVLEYMARFVKVAKIVDRGWFLKQLEKPGTVLFEGAQGVLLDQDHGFHPHTTWSKCTFENALDLLKGTDVEILRTGVLRAFHTRHGAGPFVSELGYSEGLVRSDHNAWGPWQRGFRVGAFDLVAARYAVDVVGGIDGLMVTCLDRFGSRTTIPVCVLYEGDNVEPGLFKHVNGAISRIHSAAPCAPSIQDQERLTAALREVRPFHTEFLTRTFTKTIGALLGVRRVMTSHGPTHEAKASEL
jgi:adenylosuccinate synthase